MARPRKHADTYRKTLVHAANLTGSDAAFASRLRIAPSQLRKWLDGMEQIPEEAFLNAVALVISYRPYRQRLG